MAIKALDLTETIDFTSSFDKDEPKTIWKLGVLDTRIRKQLEDISWEYEADPTQPANARARASFNLGKSEIEFVIFGLKGFENFAKPDGKPMYYKTEQKVINGKVYHVTADEIIKVIPGDIIHELAEKIKEINSVGDAERKN